MWIGETQFVRELAPRALPIREEAAALIRKLPSLHEAGRLRRGRIRACFNYISTSALQAQFTPRGTSKSLLKRFVDYADPEIAANSTHRQR